MFKKAPAVPVDSELPRPCGVRDCLRGLTFVRTGELRSMNADQLKLYVQSYSGKCTEAVSGKTSYLIKGDNPGAKKAEEAAKKGVEVINEDEFFALVETLSAKIDSNYTQSEHRGNFEFSLQPFGISNTQSSEKNDTKAEEQLLQFRFPELHQKEDMISNHNVYVQVTEYLLSEKHRCTPLFIYGPAGSGKTALLKCICDINDISLIYADPGIGVQDFREQMKVFYTPQFTLQNKRVLLAIDNPEQCPAACYKHLLTVLQNNKKNPISQLVLISADWHNQKSQTLMKYCEAFQLKRASKSLICRYLNQEFSKQISGKIEVSQGYFDILANKCNGDIRTLQYLMLMPIYNKIHNVGQYTHSYNNEDYTKVVDHVFKFQHYIRENPQGITDIIDAFYQNTGVVYASIIQNYQRYLNNDLDHIFNVSQSLSQADLVAYRMMQVGDWQGSRSCATLALLVPGLQSNDIMPIGYMFPAFPAVMSLKQQMTKQQSNSYYIMDNILMDAGSQHELFEIALKVMDQPGFGEETEIKPELYINPEILNADIDLSKHLKKYIKENAVDDIQTPGQSGKKSKKTKEK